MMTFWVRHTSIKKTFTLLLHLKNNDLRGVQKLMKILFLGLVVLLSGWLSPAYATAINLSSDEGITIYQTVLDGRLSVSELSSLSPPENQTIFLTAASEKTGAWKKSVLKIHRADDAVAVDAELVNAWSSFKKAGLDDLARSTDNLDALNKALKQDGYDAAYFENLLKSKTDPQKFINDYVSKVGDNGKFIDDALESDYTSYLSRKANEGKSARDRADWNQARDYWLNDSPMARGNAFNETARIEGWYPFDEVTLANGKRVDSYRLPEGGNPGEIVSRKATDLGDIQLSTFESYLSEMKTKYAPGTPINAPKYGNELKDKVLEGDLILELPDGNLNLSNIQDYIDLANSKSITLRFKPE